ncbi:MAG: M28 family peptidase [Planctomycetes bacterium]|nr:M28 family peptidase [Planctomycetota bacterium]
MVRRLLLIALLLASARAGEVERERLAAHVTTLASKEHGGRKGVGGRKAEAYVVAAFQETGLETIVQEVPCADGKAARNVIGIRRAGEEAAKEHLILSAHYDHLGMLGGILFPGAADNAAGCAALLELARLLPRDEKRDLIFIAFDREEERLQGSRAYCQHPVAPLEECVAMLTFDILGRDLMDATEGLLFCTGAERSDTLFDLVAKAPHPPGVELLFTGADVVGDRSDFAPFRDKKVPFLFFSTGEYRDYHAATDTAERVDMGKLERETRLILEASRRILAAPRARYLDEPALRVEEAKGLERVVAQLLAKRDQLGLSTGEALMAEGFRVSLAQIAASGELTALQRSQLVATTRLLVSTLQAAR